MKNTNSIFAMIRTGVFTNGQERIAMPVDVCGTVTLSSRNGKAIKFAVMHVVGTDL